MEVPIISSVGFISNFWRYSDCFLPNYFEEFLLIWFQLPWMVRSMATKIGIPNATEEDALRHFEASKGNSGHDKDVAIQLYKLYEKVQSFENLLSTVLGWSKCRSKRSCPVGYWFAYRFSFWPKVPSRTGPDQVILSSLDSYQLQLCSDLKMAEFTILHK